MHFITDPDDEYGNANMKDGKIDPVHQTIENVLESRLEINAPNDVSGYFPFVYGNSSDHLKSYAMADLYISARSYLEQLIEQVHDLTRNAFAKRVHVHFSAGDMGAWAYTTLTDSNIVLDPSHVYRSTNSRNKTLVHELTHEDSEILTQHKVEDKLQLAPKQGAKYLLTYRPGV